MEVIVIFSMCLGGDDSGLGLVGMASLGGVRSDTYSLVSALAATHPEYPWLPY